MDTFHAVSITDQNPEAVSDLFGQRDHTIVFLLTLLLSQFYRT